MTVSVEGTANDGIKNGGEQPLAGVSIVITNSGTVVAQDVTDSTGNASFWLPGANAGSSLVITQTNLNAYVSTGGNGGSTGGTYDRTNDTVTFTHQSGEDYTDISFGDVPPNTLAADSRMVVSPGTAIFYSHQFRAFSDGTVSFEPSQIPSPNIGGWSSTIYHDDNCDGELSPGQSPLTGSLVVHTGDIICLLVKVVIPDGAPYNAYNATTIDSTFAYSNANPALSATYQIVDTTTVGGALGLRLEKSVDKTQAKPGELITYTVTYTNEGDHVVHNVIITDVTPFATTFQSWASMNPLPQTLTAVTPSVPPAGSSGPLSFSFDGYLQPRASGWISFVVKLDL